MNDIPSASTELVRNVPLAAGAVYLNFITQYGAVIVTSLAIVYAIMQMILRVQEHRAIMHKNREVAHGSD